MLIVLIMLKVCELGTLVVPLLGLIQKEERSVALLCGQRLWKVLKVTTVYVLSLRTVLFHTVCMSGRKCSRKVRRVTDAEYTGHSFDVYGQQETELQEPQISKIERGYCYRNCEGSKSSWRVSLCGTAFLNCGCRD
jgi:hypothetical protein